MLNTMISSTPATGLSCAASSYVAAEHSAFTAPVVRVKGTGLSFASLAQVAFGARVTDLPGLPPRGAPV